MIDIHTYSSATSLTFHGNNFQELPNAPLFGQQLYTHLKVLNLSANYIVNLNSEALQGTPNIVCYFVVETLMQKVVF